jgi:hypothetical protein
MEDSQEPTVQLHNPVTKHIEENNSISVSCDKVEKLDKVLTQTRFIGSLETVPREDTTFIRTLLQSVKNIIIQADITIKINQQVLRTEKNKPHPDVD